MTDSHPLKLYRQQAGLTLDVLAARVRVTKATLSKIENRKQNPSMALATKIMEATGGAVTPNDFMPADEQRAAS